MAVASAEPYADNPDAQPTVSKQQAANWTECAVWGANWRTLFQQFVGTCCDDLLRQYVIFTLSHTYTRLMALFPGLPRLAGTRKVKPIWILLKQETVSVSSISWAICKSAPYSRQTTTPAPHHSVFYRPGALPVVQPTASKHWRQEHWRQVFSHYHSAQIVT